MQDEKRLLKANIAALIDKIANLFRISIAPGLVGSDLLKFYDTGLENAELQFKMNFNRDHERLGLLNNYVTNNIKDLNEDTMNNLRKEITRGVVNLESTDKVAARIKNVTKVTADRAKTIARTELNRAENVGHIDGARQSDLELVKQWDSHLDGRTSAVCEHLDGKQVELDAKFKYKNKEFDAPPAHPNCRSTLMFVQKDVI